MRPHMELALFAAAVAVGVLLAAGAGVSLALIASSPSMANALAALPDNPWWFRYLEAGPGSPLQPLVVAAATLCAAAAAVIAALRGYALFRGSRAPVLPYVILFFLTLAIECVRPLMGLLVAADRSVPAAIVLTRAVYWGRFAGLLALLLASLHCIDLKYGRAFVLGGGALLVAFAMAAYIPIDRTVFLSQLLWKLGDEQGIWFVNLVISVLVIGAVIGGALLKRNPRFIVLAAGFICLLAARELLFFGAQPMRLAAGLAALAAGAVLSLRSVSSDSGRFRAVHALR